MFTGLIREMAKVESFSNNILTLKAEYIPKIGDSIAVNGACLTVIKIGNKNFSVELSPESSSILALENYKNEVHIEPAMQMGDRFEGHIVQGHIDCVGVVEKIEKNGNSTDFYIKVPKEFLKYMISKGSVAIDGVSLTINEVLKSSFRLTIIPHTIQNTLFRNYKVGSKVNIETDMFARYIYNMFNKKDNLSWSDVDKIMAAY
ncbi:riboflavin synthase [Aliarcobacter skirrowii]|uniref:riboflavin synthase n=1 Tax=Aliarcobacter skirrowii TaxID=28200 RepID=UPI0029A0434C|nr:riboflavin synthase [Aliarcobacter skirrowii]MDX4012666.1 riboflavin synthase [Aliarcobacter skirrowii]MDX4026241.1 riboflavin synthase [Aliarcobacter skirrowii]MDX4035848.1 riboflavin synthase [Aliarcobacter skirrowii]MDX4048681.1 riboflavin synthase [Aliarcobacter skirrowii]MDX4067284.1 riboflavin synthase [Aliarcobacter skirrowii]